jgi:hypothetical protein
MALLPAALLVDAEAFLRYPAAPPKNGEAYDEADWNEDSGLDNAYALSKVIDALAVPSVLYAVQVSASVAGCSTKHALRLAGRHQGMSVPIVPSNRLSVVVPIGSSREGCVGGCQKGGP